MLTFLQEYLWAVGRLASVGDRGISLSGQNLAPGCIGHRHRTRSHMTRLFFTHLLLGIIFCGSMQPLHVKFRIYCLFLYFYEV